MRYPERSSNLVYQGLSLPLLAALIGTCILASSPAAHAGPSILPWLLLSQTGCADYRKAGECSVIDYFPSGRPGFTPGNFNDDDIGTLLAACNPAAIGLGWLDQETPTLPADCEDLMLEGLPLSSELEFPSTEVEQATRTALARALHALLFLPLADSGGFFGSADSEDYCPAIYEDYLGAQAAEPLDLNWLKQSDYESGLAPTGKHLVQFILERTDKFVYESSFQDDDGDGYSTMASERGGTIRLGPAFAEETNALILASMIVHESRHTVEGFPDGSRHVACSTTDELAGEKICDETNFGAYGAGAAYIDAAIRGGIRTTVGGTPLLSMKLIQYAYLDACSDYLERIENQSEALSGFFEAYTCDPGEGNMRRVLSLLYGMKVTDVLIR